MRQSQFDREQEVCRLEDWCGQKDLAFEYKISGRYVTRMKTVILAARGTWGRPYPSYFENGDVTGMYPKTRKRKGAST